MSVQKDKLKDAIRQVLNGKQGDFGSVTVKKARQWVEELLEVELSGQKDMFKELLVEVIEELRAKDEPSSEESSVEEEPVKKKRGRPPTKGKDKQVKKKKLPSDVDDDDYGHDDEYLARDLHSELNSSGRAKAHRGRKRKPKKDTDDKGEKPKRTTGLNAPQSLSPQLQSLLGGPAEMPRTEVVKKLWVLIRERGLQDPNNKRTILNDESFRQVFGCDQMDMFRMNKLLSNHLKSKADLVS